MRLRTFALVTAPLAVALTLAVSGVANAQTAPPTGYTASYFILDFADGTGTPQYAFQDNYSSGLGYTAADLIDQLAAKLTTAPAFTETYTQYSFGRFYTAFSYGAKSQASAGSAYWGFWVSNDGITWTQPQTYGASAAPLASNVWTAFSYGLNGGPSPVKPSSFAATITSGAAAPEPEAVALMSAGLAFGGAIVARRKRRA